MCPTQNDRTDEQLVLIAEEAAKTLRVGRTTLSALIKDGQLRSVHVGRSSGSPGRNCHALRPHSPASSTTGHPAGAA